MRFELRHVEPAVVIGFELVERARERGTPCRLGAASESQAAVAAVRDLLGLRPEAATALLAEGREKARQLSSFYAPVTTIKREWSVAERVRLVERLWRVTFADGLLDPNEDHYVRKIAHLL